MRFRHVSLWCFLKPSLRLAVHLNFDFLFKLCREGRDCHWASAMATLSLQTQCSVLQFRSSLSQSLRRNRGRLRVKVHGLAKPFSGKVGIFPAVGGSLNFEGRDRFSSLFCFCKMIAETEKVEDREEKEERPRLDINLAVILAGFAFEAYTTPPENVGRQEVDAANCRTIYLSESFVREIYDGQLFIKLKRGFDLPAMDPWGTSDPYVVMQLDSQTVKSQIKWGKKEPTWNEDFALNIKLHPTRIIQVAAWDANLVTPHKRMGNAAVSLDCLCDGNLHEVLVELEGMGGGGKIQLEVKYKSFEEIDKEKEWWRVPFVSELLQRYGLDSALQKLFGSETIPARQFVEYAFGQLKSFNDVNVLRDRLLGGNNDTNKGEVTSSDPDSVTDVSMETQSCSEVPLGDTSRHDENSLGEISPEETGLEPGHAIEPMTTVNKPVVSDKDFWKDFSGVLNQNVVQKLGLPVPEKLKWDGFDILKKVGLQSQRIAEAGYVESGLATPEGKDLAQDKPSDQHTKSSTQSSVPDIEKATQDLLRQIDSVLGALMVLAATVSELNKGRQENKTEDNSSSKVDNDLSRDPAHSKLPHSQNGSVLDDKKAEEMRALFSTAESAMEAWAMLSTSLGHPSFIKSEFEKVCFLDNATTDTQAAIWLDSARRRLVVAFRGTEQTKWKDLVTDLMLVPAGLNPERIGGDFKQEVQVHSGFLSAYDSVRVQIISLIKVAIGYTDEVSEGTQKWNVYVTGHSLGGALATLLALELSSSQLAKSGAISVTMYNFGSPRVGNRRFADVYNEKVKDSWRVVNHRDIIPTVPRLMGYCHVAQPVYLAPGGLKDASKDMELWRDGYEGDVIGECTPDVLVSEFMKGEKELIEKILQTEINVFRAIRDGSALMQHMEDFYYITLLENVRSNYQTVVNTQENGQSRS